MQRPILFSVAHSSASVGAIASEIALNEYTVSKIASEAAFDSLSGEFPCMIYDVGPFPVSAYDDMKIDVVNSVKPLVGIEIHCNSSGANPHASYSEVIHHRDSLPGAAAAKVIARTLGEAFAKSRHGWMSKGGRANKIPKPDKNLFFFLERTVVPCVIVEGLFISNAEQAEWLNDGGAAAYGLLVAEGVRRWMGGAKE